MRYSVSPRYEFELVVSKLSWLNKWISPMELKAAVDKAQSAMRGQAVPANDKPPPAPKQAQKNNPEPKEGNSRSDELRRMMATKAKPPLAAQPATVLPTTADNEANDDDDEPIWRTGSVKSGALNSGALGSAAQNNTAIANESAGDESPVDRVLRIIPGTVIN
jgi:DNA polymerase-3 subunit gamma/tau